MPQPRAPALCLLDDGLVDELTRDLSRSGRANWVRPDAGPFDLLRGKGIETVAGLP